MAQDGVSRGGMSHGARFQPSGCYLHHRKHMVLVLADLGLCDVISEASPY